MRNSELLKNGFVFLSFEIVLLVLSKASSQDAVIEERIKVIKRLLDAEAFRKKTLSDTFSFDFSVGFEIE